MPERHEIIRSIGSGAFGSVYEALDTQLNRRVAIKRLKAQTYTDHIELRDQLLAEAKVLAGLQHPNVVTIHDVIETADGGDIVMEFVEGQAIDERIIADGPIDLQQFLYIATQILSAMATVHEHDILHCDLKPTNIILHRLDDGNFEVKIIDFGRSPSADKKSLTQTGERNLVGSIYYMAPEQLEGAPLSAGTDIYSIGCVFYFLLSAAFPFEGESAVMIMASHISGSFTPLSQHCPDLPAKFCEWIEKHFQTNPEDRFQSCRESLAALLEITEIKPLEAFAKAYPGSQLSNTMLHSLSALQKAKLQVSDTQQKEFQKRKGISSMVKSKNLVPLVDRYKQARPKDEWYFAVHNVRKGPITYEKVCELIAQGYIRSNDTLWSVRIGQWTPAAEVPEFHEEFQAATSMPPREKKTQLVHPRNTQTVKSKPQIVQANNKPKIIDDDVAIPLVEVALAVAFMVSALIVVTVFPHYWHETLLLLCSLLLLLGMLINRFRMWQINNTWLVAGLFFPLISDLAFALVKPRKGAQCLITIVLACALLFYAFHHRTSGDWLDHPAIQSATKLVSKLY